MSVLESTSYRVVESRLLRCAIPRHQARLYLVGLWGKRKTVGDIAGLQDEL